MRTGLGAGRAGLRTVQHQHKAGWAGGWGGRRPGTSAHPWAAGFWQRLKDIPVRTEVFQQWCWNNWICREVNSDPFLIWFTEVNPKCTMDLNVKLRTVNLEDKALVSWSARCPTRQHEHAPERMDWLIGLHRNRNFCSLEEVRRMEQQATESICKSHTGTCIWRECPKL